jgi:uncharacterized protein YbjQ (UPF0145 family)
MQLSTTDSFEGREYAVLGIARGNVVQSKNIGRDILSGLKTIVGGEIRNYTKMLEEAREIATQRMIDHAASMGADGIVCLRYSTSSIMQGAAEVMVYGTAVKFK